MTKGQEALVRLGARICMECGVFLTPENQAIRDDRRPPWCESCLSKPHQRLQNLDFVLYELQSRLPGSEES